MEILPLFSRLAAGDQMKVFGSDGGHGRRIVLATNVAETSVTVPGIRYVIDPGQARVKRYRYRGKVEQLQVEGISRAAANQRAGRCGRVADGVCVRLYGADEFERRPAFTDPEILRSSLAGVILRMMALGLADGVDAVEAFPFLDAPPRRAIVDGQALLLELGALDDEGRLTDTGRTLARLPLDPRVARMLLGGRTTAALREILIVASALSVQDPRERPAEAAQAADEARKPFADERSDFVGWIKLWDWIEGLANAGLSQRKREQVLRSKFLNPRRVREWVDIHHQLQTAISDLGWQENTVAASYQALHEALLAGLLGNVGNKAGDEAHYLGTHAVRFWPHPSTGTKKGAKWLMAAELVDTTRLYARGLARIEPEWIERIGAHLIKKNWNEPHWEKKAGQVMAAERGMLYGLVVYAGRRVSFAQREPKLARELLIREGLVAGDWDSRLPFILHNQRLVAEIEQLEHRMRRPNLLVDEHRLFDFYDARIPPSVISGQMLERWWRDASRTEPQCLHLSRDFLLRREAGDAADEAADDQRFPRKLDMRGARFSLGYLFEPGDPRDGVTMNVPLPLLAQVDSVRTDWLVPGLLRDKVLALLKSLPPKIRHRCQPLVETADAFLASLPTDEAPALALTDALSECVRERTGLRPRPDDFRLETLPVHLRMNYVLADPHGRELGVGRNLAQLRAEHGREAQSALREAFASAAVGSVKGGSVKGGAADVGVVSVSTPAPASTLTPTPTSTLDARSSTPVTVEAAVSAEPQTSWVFGALPELLELRRHGQTLIGFPGLVDRGTGVTIELFDDPEVARTAHRGGVARLASIALREPLKALERAIPDLPRLAMAWLPFGSAEELRAELQAGALARTVLNQAPPMDAEQFERRVIDARPRIGLIGQAFAREVAAVLLEHQALLRKLPTAKSNPSVAADLERQLTELLPKRWPTATPTDRLGHLARYLKAMGLRLDKWRADPARDTSKSAEISPLLQNLRRAQIARRGAVDPRLEEYRWLLEELRVSLYAQELRAAVPVSVKRLQKIWESIGI
jgi:ATP-dependent helicase HrpA